MLSKDKNTWLTYLREMRDETNEAEYQRLSAFDNFMYNTLDVNRFFMNNMIYTYVLAYKENRYLNMTDNFAGYNSECFTRGGVDHTREILHEKHLQLLNSEIFPDRLNILKTLDPTEHPGYVFSYTSEVRDRKGNYCRFLQKNCFVSDENGNPVFSMGILIDVSDFYFDNRIVQTIHKINANGDQEFQHQLKKVYFLNEEDKILSKREREVLCMMSDGLSTKIIGDKLNIAESTVKRHRQNMLDKTGALNGMALVGFAHKTGII